MPWASHAQWSSCPRMCRQSLSNLVSSCVCSTFLVLTRFSRPPFVLPLANRHKLCLDQPFVHQFVISPRPSATASHLSYSMSRSAPLLRVLPHLGSQHSTPSSASGRLTWAQSRTAEGCSALHTPAATHMRWSPCSWGACGARRRLLHGAWYG